jgi:tetratricopeptide (TPR) repeat protein
MAERFALFVAVVNRHTTRDALISELAASLPELQFSTARLTAATTDILDEVLHQAGNPPPGPVMIVDFDAAISSDITAHPVLFALNLRRPAWPRLVPHPVIIWVPEYAYTLIAHEAPDFLDWRSQTIFFTDTTERDLIPLRSDMWGGGANNSFTRTERLARIAELESRLTTHTTDSNNRQILNARAAWMNELGLHFAHFGQPRKAIECFNQCLTFSRAIGNRRGEAAALGNLGAAWAQLGNSQLAITLYEQCLDLARMTGNRKAEVNALGSLGTAWIDLGDIEKAIAFDEQYLARSRAVGDRRGEGSALGNLGIAWTIRGDAQKAIVHHEQHLAITRELGDQLGEISALGNLGNAWADLGDTSKAAACYERCLAIARELGDRLSEANSCYNLALVQHQVGLVDEANRNAEQALKIYLEIESPHAEAVRRKLAEWRGESPPEPPTSPVAPS